jgi:hypothetical protein
MAHSIDSLSAAPHSESPRSTRYETRMVPPPRPKTGYEVGIKPWTLDEAVPRDANPSIFGNNSRRVGRDLHKFLWANNCESTRLHRSLSPKEQKRLELTMSRFNDNKESDDKFGYCYRNPKRYGDTKSNKIQRKADKYRRDYKVPANSDWRLDAPKNIPELIVTPAGLKEPDPTLEKKVGTEAYRLDLRDPDNPDMIYTARFQQVLLPEPRQEKFLYPRRTFTTTNELAKAKRAKLLEDKIEQIRLRDLENMRLNKVELPQYKNQLEKVSQQVERKRDRQRLSRERVIDLLHDKNEPRRLKREENFEKAKSRAVAAGNYVSYEDELNALYPKVPHRSTSKKKGKTQKEVETELIAAGLTWDFVKQYRTLKTEVLIPEGKRSEDLKKAIENADRRIVKFEAGESELAKFNKGDYKPLRRNKDEGKDTKAEDQKSSSY